MGVSLQDHLLVILDDVKGNANPDMGGGEAGGLGSRGGKIAYLEKGGSWNDIVEGAVHEIGHNRSIKSTNNWIFHTSTNEEPYKKNTIVGQRIPRPLENKN